MRELAAETGARPASSRCAWLLAQATTSCRSRAPSACAYLEENVGATDIDITPDELRRLDELFPPGAVAGERYAESGMATVER